MPAQRAPGTPAVGPESPWYSPHTGTKTSNILRDIALRDGHFFVQIYPFGVMLESRCKVSIKPPEAGKKGQILGFSHEAARRLREAFIKLHVPGWSLWAFTLTTHRAFAPVDWRAIMKRFRMALKRAGWAGIWRVELQKRRAPHAHVAFWLPEGVGHDEIQTLWLSATGEQQDPAAVKHAVRSSRIQQDDTGWAVYMGMHNGKHKESQLGWVGKQWGIWNSDTLVAREALMLEIDSRERNCLLRILRNLEASRYWLQSVLRDRKTLWMLHRHHNEYRAAMSEAHCVDYGAGWVVVPDPKPKLKPLHRGNLLRCVKGETVLAIIKGIKSGRIYPL